ncbi:hypothetical protein [Chitinophaga polysaccharea]|nr:hypothetical protein [Chitinophaga polysaccharea]
MKLRITCIKKDGGNHENEYVSISSFTVYEELNKNTTTITRENLYEWVKNGGYAQYPDVLTHVFLNQLTQST